MDRVARGLFGIAVLISLIQVILFIYFPLDIGTFYVSYDRLMLRLTIHAFDTGSTSLFHLI